MMENGPENGPSSSAQSVRSYLVGQFFSCTCPRCSRGPLFSKGLFNLTFLPVCPVCGLDLAKNDSADGPAVFLIFILGFLLVPMALFVDHVWEPPLWFHAVFWGGLAIGVTIGTLKPIKSLVIAIQFRQRPADWDE